ncbi:MAG: hypothetical protein F6K11_17500 [Leptolyngbya sp. SIO3F4]|nr:hypothetical protein [Leptolyngbya sp. SIO3F4]
MNSISKITRRWMVPAITSSLCLMAQAPSQALQFNFSYEKDTPYEQILGFEVAGNWWASQISDDVTLNIHIGTSNDLPKNVVGGALPAMKAFRSYERFQSKLQDDASSSSADDISATFRGGLKTYKNRDGITYFKGRLESKTWNIYKTSLTNANAKAVGFSNAHSQALDGMIMMSDLSNTKYHWNYDFERSDSIDNKSLDFLSVAVHEIGHTLGFISAFDTVNKHEGTATREENLERVKRTTSLDLFRHSNTAGQGVVELRAGKASYFSVDGGNNKIADFARGNKNIGNGSDGYQASHWKHQNKNALGIMGPAIRLGERRNIAKLDLRALDAIGWDLKTNVKQQNINFGLLQTQAETKLAQKLGRGTSWLKQNKNTAANQLTSTNTKLLADMVGESDTYYQLFGANALGSAGWWQLLNDLGYGGWWQEYIANNAYGQKAYFSTLEDPKPVDVPEPTSVLGLFGTVLLSFLGQRQIQKQSK